MAVLSKPYKIALGLLGAYFNNLYMNPLRTKSLTAAVVSILGNLTAQSLYAESVNYQSVAAFGLFGLLFGGSLPHFFYEFLQRVVDEDSKFASIKMLLLERTIFTPLFSLISLYTLSRFEFKSHAEALSSLNRFYLPILEANLKILTIAHFFNMKFVPPLLRVLVGNLIGFFWVIYVARRRSQPQKKSRRPLTKSR